MSFRRFMYIVKKEFIHIKRDKASLFIMLIMPTFMMLLFGYALKTEVTNVSTAVYDEDNTTESRELIKSYMNSNYFDMNYYVDNFSDLKSLIYSGKAKAGIVIPPGYGKSIHQGKSSEVALYIDGSDPTVARTALSSGVMTGQIYSLNLNKDIMYRKGMSINSSMVDIRPKVWFNPELKSELFTIPGLICIVMQNVTVILTAFALVREKERGTIEQLIVTPVNSIELILGKLVPYIFIGIIEFLWVLVMGTFLFNVPVAGSVGLLIILGIGFVICALAIGMLISTVARTQAQAMQASVLFLLPSILLSGFMFPRDAMPKLISYIGFLIPATYFLNISRGIILKGLSFHDMSFDIYMLLALGTLLLAAAILRFRKKLD